MNELAAVAEADESELPPRVRKLVQLNRATDPRPKLIITPRGFVPSETFVVFEQLVSEHCQPAAKTRLFSVHTSSCGATMNPEDKPFPSSFLDMGELSRESSQRYAVKITHHGTRRLALRCHLDGIPFVSLKYDGRPIVPGMVRTIEVQADGRYERSPHEWCSVLKIEGTELLPGPMTASLDPAGHATAHVPIYAKMTMLSDASRGSSTPRAGAVSPNRRSCLPGTVPCS
ncbi:hypothetical protein T492DRAFT_1018062 [Pavlovales sp. CCMP2436]|nr:hypothetical protein T492DRAFT_1018062 [Pavlovales sp. CCMP2436]|mmetsp:Transcript_15541/g.39499  ORF Transcript_15541/g.39499 Transcript_15541/m.39499 type:complete len:230 (-) Transcript_15541:154-843(-)